MARYGSQENFAIPWQACRLPGAPSASAEGACRVLSLSQGATATPHVSEAGRLEVDRPAVLQQIGEGFAARSWKIPHAVLGEQVEGVPGLLIELNALAGRAYPAVAL